MADEMPDFFSESLRADFARLRQQSSEARARLEELQRRIGILEKIFEEPLVADGISDDAASA